MSHIPYTICRSGTYYYNRRVPIHAVNSYGHFIRQHHQTPHATSWLDWLQTGRECVAEIGGYKFG